MHEAEKVQIREQYDSLNNQVKERWDDVQALCYQREQMLIQRDTQIRELEAMNHELEKSMIEIQSACQAVEQERNHLNALVSQKDNEIGQAQERMILIEKKYERKCEKLVSEIKLEM